MPAASQSQSRAQGRAEAAHRALAEPAVASIPRQSGPSWGEWQGSTLAVAAEIEPPTGKPARPRTIGRPATAGLIHAGQIIAWQLAIAAAVVAVEQPVDILLPIFLAVAIVLAATTTRLNGRWAYQWLGIWLRYACRRRARSMPAGAPITELLHTFVRGARIDSVEIDEVPKAILTHTGGLTAILELTPEHAGMLVEPSVVVPAPNVLLPAVEDGGSSLTAQLIVQTTPAPGANRSYGVVAHSYQMLGQGIVPARRRSWIALQVMRTAADGTDDDAEMRTLLVNGISRLQRRLRHLDIRGTVLDSSQLTADLAELAGADTVRRSDGTTEVRLHERWRSWSAGPYAHTAYRFLEWPDLGTHSGREFFDRIISLPSLTTVAGLAARRTTRRAGWSGHGEEFELEAVLRVAVLPNQMDMFAAELTDLTRRHGVRLQCMDGEQAFGVAASLPLGGFVV